MTKILVHIISSFVILLGFSNCKTLKRGQQSPNTSNTVKEIAFSPYLPKGKVFFDEKIKISLKTDTVQYKSNDSSIKLSIIFINDSTEKIKTINPLDFLHIRLWTDSIANIFPDQISRAKYDSPLPFSYTTFNIEKILINSLIDSVNLNSQKYFEIPAKSKCEILLSFNKVLKTNSGGKVNRPKETVELIPGHYKLGATIGISLNGVLENFGTNLIGINYN